jgi:hypothetical protein
MQRRFGESFVYLMVTCIVFAFVQHHTLKGGIFKRHFVLSVAQLMCKAVYVSFPVSSLWPTTVNSHIRKCVITLVG